MPNAKPWTEELLLLLIQIIGLTSAIVFGIFSTLAWVDGTKSTGEARTANVLAVLAWCHDIRNANVSAPIELDDLCASITASAQSSLIAITTSLFPDVQLPMSGSLSTEPKSGESSMSSEAIAGLVVGLVLGFITILVRGLSLYHRTQQQRGSSGRAEIEEK